MGGRLELLMGPMGLVFIGLLFLIALLMFARRRLGGGGPSMDFMGLDPETPEKGQGGRSPQNIYPSFQALLEQFAAPRRQAYPYWERLDGAVDVRGKPIATFEHQGTVYALNGETSFAALEALEAWMQEHPGEDPLMIVPGKGSRGRLGPRPEITLPDQATLRIETV